jgi:predicted amidohydrolase
MACHRREFLQLALAGPAAAARRTIPIALVQFDAIPEQVDRNAGAVERLTGKAVAAGARWVMFHEGTLCDYTANLKELAQPVPEGRSVRRLESLARRLGCYLSYGLSEAAHGRYHIAQVFTGPEGFIYRYRKTWIWHDRADKDFRDEWVRYDPGAGPELFVMDGVKATCFICSDGNSRRCLQRAGELAPEVVFHPNNRGVLEESGVYDVRARAVGAPLLVTNRVGLSWGKKTTGGCAVYSGKGELLARANREGKEEILRYDLRLG